MDKSSRVAPSLNVLFCASEALPLIKTGGLADVAGSLPSAIRALGHDVRLFLPAYPRAVQKARDLRPAASLRLPGQPRPVRLLRGTVGQDTPLYLVDAPWYFDRPGNPYLGPEGRDWDDNAERFTLYCRTAVELAMGRAGLDWRPDVVHANDWQTGLLPPLVAMEGRERPGTLLTIHNLAYRGMFDRATFNRLGLPEPLWSPDGMEFHNQLSLLKGGIVFSDLVTTVSPTYAREICTPALGYGMEGLLRHLGNRLVGVLNGADYGHWNPAADPHIAQAYDADTFHLKRVNKLALQREMELPEDEQAMVFGQIGRLVEQKGLDLILTVLPSIMQRAHTQMVILGSGDRALERGVRAAADRYPGRVAIHLGYDEALAHRVEAGCDCFLMPSRFEPCGLNQIYSLRYGAVPLVRRTGGLADTVVDASPETIANGTATGFVFNHPDPAGLWHAVDRALMMWEGSPDQWRRIAVTGMRQDFSWDRSARRYLDLYRRAMAEPLLHPLAK
jgi:starch synthase